MKEDLNNRVVSAILKHLSKNDSIIPFLCKSFGLSKESVYRRLRNAIPFTFEEISALSMELGFSVDEIIGNINREHAYFNIQADTFREPSEAFKITLEEHYKIILGLSKAEKSESIVALDRIPAIFASGFEHLFRFYYFKWLHQSNRTSANIYFSEVTLPEEIIDLHRRIYFTSQLKSHTTFIFEEDTILNTIKEIQFFYKLKSITFDELLVLKKDMLKYMIYSEQLIQKGENGNNAKYQHYFSTLKLESNSSITIADDDVATHFWIYPITPITVRNRKICEIHKAWLESLKKYSTLITKSSEMLRTEYLNKQFEYINNMDQTMY